MSFIGKESFDYFMGDIQASEKMLECYQIRLFLINQNYANKNIYEKNEFEIIKLLTETKIDKLIEIIKVKKDKFYEYLDALILTIENELI